MLDVIRHGYVKITDFNLMVFDECHHGRNDHPMHQLMECFSKYPESELPRVIGLSGMLTSSSIKAPNVRENLEELEATFRSTIATVKGMGAFQNVLLFSTCPKESFLPYEVFHPCDLIQFITKRMDALVVEIKDWPIDSTHERSDTKDLQKNKGASPIKKIGKLFNDLNYQMKDLG